MEGYVYSVNLFAYTETTSLNRCVYWMLYVSLILFGIVQVILTKIKIENGHHFLMDVSMILNILMVLFLAMTREVYAVMVAFLLLVIKGIILLKCVKAGN